MLLRLRLRHIAVPALLAVIAGCTTSVDGSGAAPPPDGTTTPESGPLGLRVFITSATFTGNLTAAARKADGLEAADALCQTAADGANLGGRFMAYLSSKNEDAVTRFAEDGPFHLLDGRTVAYANASSVGGGTMADVTTEKGSPLLHESFWTGSSAAGRASGDDCMGWTDESLFNDGAMASAYGGDSEVELACEHSHHLLCLEQNAPAVAPTTKRIFVTSKGIGGDMGKTGSALVAADAHCKSAASAAGLEGKYVAWLSAKVDGKVVRATERVAEARYVLLDDRIAFGSKKDLLTEPAVPIELNEFGAKVPEHTEVWTGTLKGGAPATTYTCNDWSSHLDWGIGGYVNGFQQFGPTELWTGPDTETPGGYANCSELKSLYCFEQ
jgi:hypothetical protein